MNAPVEITKFGARWVVDGPEGRFHTRTKAEALRLLAEAHGRNEKCRRCATWVSYGTLNNEMWCRRCEEVSA